MKYTLVLLLMAGAAQGQTAKTGGGSISGTVVDGKTQRPVPAALVTASRAGAPPLTRNTKSGADCGFEIQGLAPGDYRVCVQVSGDQYLNPCEWNGTAGGVTLVSEQGATGVKIALVPASVVSVEVIDGQKVMSELNKDGRSPDLNVGVWGPNGMYYPAQAVKSPIGSSGPQGSIDKHNYRLAIPRDTALKLHVASQDLRLGDSKGAALPVNGSQQAFQHRTGDANPQSFTFSILGWSH